MVRISAQEIATSEFTCIPPEKMQRKTIVLPPRSFNVRLFPPGRHSRGAPSREEAASSREEYTRSRIECTIPVCTHRYAEDFEEILHKPETGTQGRKILMLACTPKLPAHDGPSPAGSRPGERARARASDVAGGGDAPPEAETPHRAHRILFVPDVRGRGRAVAGRGRAVPKRRSSTQELAPYTLVLRVPALALQGRDVPLPAAIAQSWCFCSAHLGPTPLAAQACFFHRCSCCPLWRALYVVFSAPWRTTYESAKSIRKTSIGT